MTRPKVLSYNGIEKIIDSSTMTGKLHEALIRQIGIPYTMDIGIAVLNEKLGADAGVLARLDNREVVRPDAIKELYLTACDDASALASALDAYDFPERDGQRVYVPKILWGLLEIDDSRRSLAIGKGEIAALLMFRNIRTGSTPRYDVYHINTPWHVKNHRGSEKDGRFQACNATTLGRPTKTTETDKLLVDWKNAEPMKFVWNLLGKDQSSDFGCDDFLDDERIELALKARYMTDELPEAARKLEHELDEIMRNSVPMGEAPGLLILKDDRDGLGPYFERFDKKRLHFYAVSAGDLKVCEKPGRFVQAILTRTEHAAKLVADQEASRIKAETKADVKKLREVLDKNIKILSRVKTAYDDRDEILEFNEKWNNASDIVTLASDLGIQKEAVKAKKKRIENRLPRLFFKEFKAPPRAKKTVSKKMRKVA